MPDNHGSTPYDGSQNQNPQNQPGGYQGYSGQQGYPNHQGGWQNQPHQQNGQWQQQAPQQPKKNWFLRHKILTAILALVLIGIIASVAGGSKKDDTASGSSSAAANTANSAAAMSGETKAGETKASDSKDDDSKDKALPAVGQPIRDGKFEFIVTKVERNVPSIGGEFMNKKAQGAYTLVHVTVKNVGDETQTMSASGQKAYDAKGIGYEATSDGAIYIEGNDTLYTEINPGNSLKGVLVFDAPKGTTLTKVRLHDSMFSNGAEGSLG